jgi:hypothetical protein
VCDEAPHVVEEDGAMGTIIALQPTGHLLTHHMFVQFSEDVLYRSGRGRLVSLHSRHYAREELELLPRTRDD